ncbi:uncharacterized protein (DUF1499 family) [Desulfobaculum xiamenense]|uniref:Uncharacterized protein (DUF1499 family) n=1 Tax=Desulfobaculum xiamenense TaxID=995050 RepID=A0A846QN88_9BACT|nr:DUF1499 domain-containing protein [Desulfobaculum xiamenense]NJB66875.1 uncharacterized protein (DUF1499 family) [Desulfobaculum xiamenense]
MIRRMLMTALAGTLALAACSGCSGGADALRERLAPCPGSPNCVSSLADDRHGIAPLRMSGNTVSVMNRLKAVIESMPGVDIVSVDGAYLHAVFSSRIFGFRDDLECLYVESEGRVHIRSASRLGYWDFGVNRRRIELLRERIAER